MCPLCAVARGVWEHAPPPPPRKFLNFKCSGGAHAGESPPVLHAVSGHGIACKHIAGLWDTKSRKSKRGNEQLLFPEPETIPATEKEDYRGQ